MAMMLLGVILFRKGFLSAEKSETFYMKWAIGGITIGLIISFIGLHLSYEMNWEGGFMMNLGLKANYIASSFQSVGYMALVIFFFKSGFWKATQNFLQKIGRMAFTNYILMSLVGTFIFYGHGFGFFEQFDRLQQLFTVLAIWLVVIGATYTVLGRWKQGPLEWLWRKLTYFSFNKE